MTKNISNEPILLELIKNILNYSGKQQSNIGVEGMDDCALLKISEENSLAVTSDFVRGSGFTLFKLGLLSYYDVGYYLISANLSDLAAVGASPIGLTTIVRYANMDDGDFESVFRGMKDAADLHSTPIIGGDIGSYQSDVFAATAFGLIKTENALLRSNAKDGDALCVTGIIGKPITTLLYFKEVKSMGFELSESEEKELLLSWKKPNARIKEGQILSENAANACQDISDGLKATIEQMSRLSQKTFTIFSDRIPIDPITKRLADFLKVDPIQIAMSASVDFELLFTVPKEKVESFLQSFKAHQKNFTVIGEVNDKGENVLFSQGDFRKLPGITWDHRPIQEVLNEIVTDNQSIPRV